MKRTFTTSTIRATVIVTVFSLMAQMVGFLIQVFIARTFGSSVTASTYIIALSIPQYISIVINAAFTAIFIPQYTEYKINRGTTEANEFVIQSIILISVISMVVMFFCFFFNSELIAFFFKNVSEIARPNIISCFKILLPTIFTNILINLFSLLLQAKKKFTNQAIIPVIGQLLNFTLLLLLTKQYQSQGLAFAYLMNQCIQLGLLSIIIFRVLKNVGFTFQKPIFMGLVKVLTIPLLSAVLVKCTPLLDRFLSANLSSSAVAHVDYANKIISIVSLFLLNALPIVIFPNLSIYASEKKFPQFNKTVTDCLSLMLFIILPSMIIGFCFRVSLVQLIMQGGAFTSTDTQIVSVLLIPYILFILPSSFGAITGKALYALGLAKITSILSMIEAAFYICYSYWFSKLFGVIGIPIGFLCYHTISITWALILIHNKTKFLNNFFANSRKNISKMILISVIIFCLAWFLSHLIKSVYINVFVGISVCGIAYISLGYYFKIEEIMLLFRLVNEKVKNKKPRV